VVKSVSGVVSASRVVAIGLDWGECGG